ncbi:cation:proton antiporter [Nocardioides sp. NPDC047086]|uniref:cation:proton antiporter domain-containing protein n=1 Tax=Nocardioides sp. NPDC047086 TaxID=3154810 RepID=UPI0033CD6ED0
MYVAILLATEGAVSNWALEWVGFYLVGKIVIGVLAGLVVGKILAYIAFRSSSRSLRVAERGESLLALAALIGSYGVGEVLGGYGFLSVFVCAMAVAERLERLLTLFVLLILGIALTRGLLEALDWRGIAIGLALILVVRPAAGILALAPWPGRGEPRSPLTRRQRWATAFFGVRGVGSVYYLAYAAGQDEALAQDWLWSTVAFTIVASVLVHGVLATPVMARVDPARE